VTQPDDTLLHDIVHAENRFPESFAETFDFDWGVAFYTPSIPESHDGNHACIQEHEGNPETVIREILSFYEARGRAPRANRVSADGEDDALRQALAEAGFVFAFENAMRVFVFQEPSKVVCNPAVRVRGVRALDSELFEAISELNCPRVAKVLQRRLARQSAVLYVGELDGQPVSIALLERTERLWRVDEVHTHDAYRSQGCARAVIHTLVSFYAAETRSPLYLWTDNPIAARLYAEAGFRELDVRPTSWTAWLPEPHP